MSDLTTRAGDTIGTAPRHSSQTLRLHGPRAQLSDLSSGSVAVCPGGLGLIGPEIFGDELPPIVGLSVAIIVFEGAFHLHIDRLREAPHETLRLATVGARVSLVGTAVVIRFTAGASWDITLLVGALLVAAGPTVITPIMNVVPHCASANSKPRSTAPSPA